MVERTVSGGRVHKLLSMQSRVTPVKVIIFSSNQNQRVKSSSNNYYTQLLVTLQCIWDLANPEELVYVCHVVPFTTSHPNMLVGSSLKCGDG